MEYALGSQVILTIHHETSREEVSQVPITPQTTCADVIACCRNSTPLSCHLVESWRSIERALDNQERPYDILIQWGIHRDEVRFYLRYTVPEPTAIHGRAGIQENRMRDTYGMMDGREEMTMKELREMAERQKQQIEAQQRMLVAKEQRLKYLRQQEAWQQQAASQKEQMEQRVAAQELKLQKLRALKGQVEQYKASNGNLVSELEAVRAVFKEKEKELALAVATSTRLAQQLEELRGGAPQPYPDNVPKLALSQQELDRLRQEIVLRNKWNAQQTQKLANQQEILSKKQAEVAQMDKRITELKARLHKKRALQQQRQQQKKDAEKSGGDSQASGLKVGLKTEVQKPGQGIQDGSLSKQDPKYQTLPYSIKFSTLEEKKNEQNNNDQGKPYSDAEEIKIDFPPASSGSDVKSSASVPAKQSATAGKPVVPVTGASSTTVRTSSSSMGTSLSRPNVSTSTSVSKPSTSLHSLPVPTSISSSASARSVSTSHHNQSVPSVSSHVSSSGNNGVPLSAPMTKFSVTNLAPRPYGSTFSTSKVIGKPVESPQPSTPSSVNTSFMPVSPLPKTSTPITADTKTSVADRAKGKPVSAAESQPASVASLSKVVSPPAGHQTVNSMSPTKPPTEGTSQSFQKPPPPYPGTTATSGTSTPNQSSVSLPPRVLSPVQSSLDQTDSNLSPKDSKLLQYSTAISPPSGQSSRTSTGGDHRANRFASRKDIANTYTSRLSQAAMEKYRQNMNQIYKDNWAGNQSVEQKGRPFSPPAYGSSSPQRSLDYGPGPSQPGGYPKGEPDVGDVVDGRPMSPQRGQPPPYPGSPPYVVEPERMHYHPNAPRPLRIRRPSLGEADDPRTRGISSPTKQSSLSPPHQVPVVTPDVITVSQPDHPQNQNQSEPVQPQTQPPPQIQVVQEPSQPSHVQKVILKQKKSNVRNKDAPKGKRRVSFDPLALLLDASLEGELDLVMKTAREYCMAVKSVAPLNQVPDPSEPNDEGITCLHNAICAGHFEIVRFLVEFGCNVNSPDSDGWTPLHCAASCNNLPMVRLLVEHGACIFATTTSDKETAAEKCEEDEDGYDGCSQYLFNIQENMGVMNNGVIYALFDYEKENADELSFRAGNRMIVLRRGDDKEKDWWWCRHGDKEGYVPRNLMGVYPRAEPQFGKDKKNEGT